MQNLGFVMAMIAYLEDALGTINLLNRISFEDCDKISIFKDLEKEIEKNMTP